MQEQSNPKRSPSFLASPGRADVDYQSRHAARRRTLDHRQIRGASAAGTRSPVVRESGGVGRGQPRAAGRASLVSSRFQEPAGCARASPQRCGRTESLSGAGTAENEHDLRLHEAMRKEEKWPAGQ